MRKLLMFAGASSVVLVALATAGISVADEYYFCEDGRTLQVTSQNRAKMMQDPCIQAWFDNNQSNSKARAAAEKKKAETAPQTMVGLPAGGEGGGDMSSLIPFLFGRR